MEGAKLTILTESPFAIKDSGARQEFAGGMVRDTTEGKTNFLNVRFGPMFRRWAEHLTKGREKYPDPEPGVPNWTLAQGVGEYLRAKESAARHFEQWLAGDRDEDHAAGVFFNINLAEYVMQKAGARGDYIDPALGAGMDVTPKIDLGGEIRFAVGDRVRVKDMDDVAFDVSGRAGEIVPLPEYEDGRWDYFVRLDNYSDVPLGFKEDELLPA